MHSTGSFRIGGSPLDGVGIRSKNATAGGGRTIRAPRFTPRHRRRDHSCLPGTEYPLPNAGARPRRLALSPDGTIYFTDYARGYLGHFDPKTKQVDEWASPGGAASKPYGIAVTSDGIVWYSESGVSPNTLVRFDPRSKGFSSTAIPSGGGVVRNMVATPDGRLFLACSGVNKIAVAEIAR